MATTRTRRRPSSRRSPSGVGKPRGVLHPRVRQVGPEHFGIVCFDPAKVRSKFLLADFYGRVLIPPTWVAHNRPELEAAVAQIRQAFATHDVLIAIERTGRYHRVVQRTFAAAGFETRIVHPFVTKQYRQPVATPPALTSSGRVRCPGICSSIFPRPQACAEEDGYTSLSGNALNKLLRKQGTSLREVKQRLANGNGR